MTAICYFICALITSLSSITFRFSVNHEKPFSGVVKTGFQELQSLKIVTQHLKVVETCFWAQNDRNVCYFVCELTTLCSTNFRFSVNHKKLVSGIAKIAFGNRDHQKS